MINNLSYLFGQVMGYGLIFIVIIYLIKKFFGIEEKNNKKSEKIKEEFIIE